MSADDIKPYDFYRILIGEVPWSFLIEVIFRTAFIFLVLLISMRLLGKRMAGQLNRNELIALSTLAAAIGVPIQAPDRGLLPALLIAIVVIIVGRMISRFSFTNKKFEEKSQGELSVLVEDSVMQLSELKKNSISRERLFSQLRSKEVTHLGQVKRVYFEAGGFFTLIKNNPVKPGLCIIPNWDLDLIAEKKHSPSERVCRSCGMLMKDKTCQNCGNEKTEAALVE
jgi:uncharacterized membrane protein YcaP (DUF421 family)